MYIDSIALERFRTFRKCRIDFLYPNQDLNHIGLPTPRLSNVNLLLGDNGFGKTTLLKAVALAALGPAVSDAGIYPYRLVRREPQSGTRAGKILGVSHLLHTWWPRHVRALLYKRGNIEGEGLHRLIYLDVVLPSGGRPDAVVVFLSPAQQTHPRLGV